MPRVNIERWLAAHRHDNDFHAVGPYLRAEEAIWRVAPPETAVIGGTGKDDRNSLEAALNRAGRFFYRIPALASTPELRRFESIFVAAGAYDNDAAGVRALFPRLVSYARSGGRLVVCGQQRQAELLSALPPGLDAALAGSKDSGSGGWTSVGEPGERVCTLQYGSGTITYWSGDDYQAIAKNPAINE